MRTYTPPPGTIAHKAVRWLQQNAPTREVQNSALAKSIDADPNSMSGCLGKALKTGWLVRRYAGPGFSSFWRLGPAALPLTETKPAPAAKPLRPPGHFTALMRLHAWPPRYRPHFALERAPGSQYLRVVDLVGGRAAA